MKYAFILKNENKYPVEKMCKCMKVSRNAYCHWFKQKSVIKEKTVTMVRANASKFLLDWSQR
jgi:putative transposase